MRRPLATSTSSNPCMGISGSQALTSCMPCQRANSLATLAEGYGEIGTEIKKAAQGDFDYHVISALLVEVSGS